MPLTERWLTASTLIAWLCCLAFAREADGPGTMPLDSIVAAVEKTQAGQFSYQETREYRLFGTNNLTALSHVVAEIRIAPPGNADYTIQKASGSNRGREIIRGVLDHEVEMSSSENQTRIALTRNNYDFTYIAETILDGHGCYRLGLKPKRKEKELISGEAWIDKHSFVVRQIEGELASVPSWWLKSVWVKLLFSEREGDWVLTSVEAVGEVRIIGRHTLTSRLLDYHGGGKVASTKSARPRGQ